MAAAVTELRVLTNAREKGPLRPSLLPCLPGPRPPPAGERKRKGAASEPGPVGEVSDARVMEEEEGSQRRVPNVTQEVDGWDWKPHGLSPRPGRGAGLPHLPQVPG